MATQRQRRRFEIYPEFSGFGVYAYKQRYRWRLVASNNRVIADSGYSYESVSATRKAIKRVRQTTSQAGVIVLNTKGGWSN